MKYFTLFFFTISVLIYPQSENYKQVKIYLQDRNEITSLLQMGLEFDHAEYTKDNAIIVFLSEAEFSILQSSGFNYEILIDDWFEHYNSRPLLTESEKQQSINESVRQFNVSGFGYGSMGGYYTLAEIYAELDTMHMLYPNIITEKFIIGYTIENRPIYAVKISDNPNVNEDEPQAHFNALIHAREPQAMMTIMYYMYYLLENYGTDPEATYLVNNREIYFVPCINPDGYEYNRQTNPNGGGFWRKNRRNNGGSYGVDLNRNFGYQWGYNNVGSSGTPTSETYRGTAPFSEPETQAIRNFCNSKNFKTVLNYHTYGNLLLFPWSYISTPTSDNAVFVEYSSDMVGYNGYENGQPPIILYEVNGSSDDWMYGDQISKPKIFAMTPEVGGSFWPSQSLIFPLAQENVKPNLYYTWAAGEFVNLVNAGFSQQLFNPGDFVEIIIPSLRNKGLSDAQNISLTLSSDNPEIIINNGSLTIGDIPSRTTVNNSQNLSFTIGSSMPADILVKMMVTVYTNGTPMLVDTMSFITGTPTTVFIDTTNNPLNLWTITAAPLSSPKWEETTTTYYSAPNSYTDSKTGNYINNATVTMTLTNSLDLSQYNNPKLVFWTKYDIESNWDYGWVRVSTNNGATWTPLEGIYTEPGVGSFQPSGQPVYDGVQSAWVREEMSLTGYTGSQVKFQFQLVTDGAVTRDGWYVDDISVEAYTIIPVELTSFTANLIDNKVTLKWSTASELNNHGFEIQRNRSSEERSYVTVGYVEGKGTTTETTEYIFVDKSPITGVSNYRLKQVDYDGTYKYYGPVTVEYSGIIDYELSQNYPNPFNPATVIKYSIPQDGEVSIKLYNILGVEIAELVNEYKEAGKHSLEFSVDALDGKIGSGVYFYTLKSGSYTQTRKMILLR
jgi:carboxypeptidase T